MIKIVSLNRWLGRSLQMQKSLSVLISNLSNIQENLALTTHWVIVSHVLQEEIYLGKVLKASVTQLSSRKIQY